MTQTILAVYENGILRPLEHLQLQEQQQVRVTVESEATVPVQDASSQEDPLAGLRVSTGIPDLAEKFDDYRLGNRTT